MSAEELDTEAIAALRKKRVFKKLTYRGKTLEQLLDMKSEEFLKTVHARARRRLNRGHGARCERLLKKIKDAKASSVEGKVKTVKTHLRNMLITPEMVGAQVCVYNGKVFNLVEIKVDMVGYYLAEFSISYRPVRHGRPGLGDAKTAKFMPMGK